MKVLLLCGLILAGAFLAEAAGGRELCGKSNDEIKAVLKCMGEHVPAELKGKAAAIINSKGDNLAELVQKQCDADIDFVELLEAVFSGDEAEAIKKAYRECKPSRR
ncbi:hypothetical protein MTO96_016554 [Rhipicephalus appendiculatus]